MNPARHRAQGFTLIELIMVVAILAILAAITAPSMRDFVKAAGVRGASSDFYSALVAARAEAIKRRASVSVAPAVGTSWTSGWTVASGGSTFQKADPLPSEVAVKDAATTITYGANGRVSAGAQTVVFYIAGSTTIPARCVSIDTNGLPRVRTDSNKDASDGCN